MLNITVNGVVFPVPSSARDQDWAAQQVAFLQALAAGVNANTTAAAAAAASAAAAAASAAAASAAAAAVSAGALPSDVVGDPGSGPGFSAPSTNYGRHVVHKITVGYQALNVAASSTTIVLWQLPARTRVLRVVADVTEAFAAGSLTNMNVEVGDPVSTTDDFLLSFDAITTGTFGQLQPELGAGVLGGTGFASDLLAWTSTQDVTGTFSAVGDVLDALTQGSVSFYIECCTYP